MSEQSTPAAVPAPAGRNRAALVLFLLVLGSVIGGGAWFYLSGMGVEETDDAFIAGSVYQVAPKIAGRLTSILVHDNEEVKAGQLLAELDAGDQEVAVAQARAARALALAQLEEATVQVTLVEASTAAMVKQAEAEVASAEAKAEQERAELASANAESERAKSDLERYAKLSEEAVSRQRLDLVRATAIAAESALRAVEKQVVSAEAVRIAAEAKRAAAEADLQRVDAAKAQVRRCEAQVAEADAKLAQAELQRSYTRIVAPADGRVTNKAVQVGDFVKEGRTLLSLVPAEVWVVANFKETQLRDMRPGQACTVHIDAYGIDLPAHVESIQAGSGATFSLLPPQNATGNYVKVVQRVPVKIVFDRPEDVRQQLLGPGMSVVPRVVTR